MRALLVLPLVAAGCASISNVQTADTLGRGNFQIGIEPGVLGVASGSGLATVPHIDAAVRFGVSEGVDLGVRAGFSFLELQGKFLFTRPGAPNLAISFAPTVGGLVTSVGTSSLAWLNIGLPVLVGIKFSGGHELVIGPRLQNLVVLGGSTSAGGIYGLAVGSSLGFAIRLSDFFGLLPELSAVYPVAGGAAFAGQSAFSANLNAGGAIVQFKLGFLIGKFRPLEGAAPARGRVPREVPVANQPYPANDLTPPPMPPPQ